ncbi:MAG: hypothetical protein IJF07_00925 [Lachnospiraceae bacterium]|nr:hypothetical protein [Lachnospiraceae bacterium]
MWLDERYHGEIVSDIYDTIEVLHLKEEVQILEGEERRQVLQNLQDIFVEGNPRVWWLSLKYQPRTYVFDEERPWLHITDFFDNLNRTMQRIMIFVIFCKVPA